MFELELDRARAKKQSFHVAPRKRVQRFPELFLENRGIKNIYVCFTSPFSSDVIPKGV